MICFMRIKLANTIYIVALFLYLLCLFIPVFPFALQVCATCLFVIYMLLGGIKTNLPYKKWTLSYLSFFLISALWALKAKFVIYIIVVNILPILIMVFATTTYIKRNQSINVVLFVIYITS